MSPILPLKHDISYVQPHPSLPFEESATVAYNNPKWMMKTAVDSEVQNSMLLGRSQFSKKPV